jgi:hypothetical protein
MWKYSVAVLRMIIKAKNNAERTNKFAALHWEANVTFYSHTLSIGMFL